MQMMTKHHFAQLFRNCSIYLLLLLLMISEHKVCFFIFSFTFSAGRRCFFIDILWPPRAHLSNLCNRIYSRRSVLRSRFFQPKVLTVSSSFALSDRHATVFLFNFVFFPRRFDIFRASLASAFFSIHTRKEAFGPF